MSIETTAARLIKAGDCEPRLARDPVNTPTIRNWTEALGDRTDYGDLAPEAMIQVWTMQGLGGQRADDDPLGIMIQTLDDAGFPGVVATNCDQVYHRPVKVGEQVSVRTRLLDVRGPKRTALGEGWFVTTRSTWFAAGEPVAGMDFRVLKYRPEAPAEPAAKTPVMRPPVTPDTAFFWAGTAAGELRIQRCGACGTLRHPPGPMCADCGQPQTGDYLVAGGTGEIYSYVVHHHPPVPGRKTPFTVALVELPEGVRVLGELRGIPPDHVRIGMPVRSALIKVDEDLTLPGWRPADEFAPLCLDVTPTFVVSTALATRDFQDVHHDRDRARAGGARDIFLNILTTTGLVQRYVRESVPGARPRAISIRLGVPCQAGDTLTFTGRAASDGTVNVTGSCGPGDHVTAAVSLR
jgi:uncharacterized OB-fold protein/acyl dehydratase